MFIYAGTYTEGTSSKGIYIFRVDDRCERFDPIGWVPAVNPSYLVSHPALPIVYAVSEVSGEGLLVAYTCQVDGRLTERARVSTLGDDPCHLEVAASGKYLLASNYSSGSLASFKLDAEGLPGEAESLLVHHGSSVNPVRQSTPHVHSASDWNDGEILVADLGTDELVRYTISRNGHIDATSRKVRRLRPGAGPRHLVYTESGRYHYLINELDNTVVAFELRSNGDLLEVGTFEALPASYSGASYAAGISCSLDGRFLYVSNRGHDSITAFRIEEDGSLVQLQRQTTAGRHPRHFALTPDQRFVIVANKDSDSLTVLARDSHTGQLDDTGVRVALPSPTCVLFCPEKP